VLLPVQAQQLVNASQLSIERFALTRPMGDTALASVDATLSMPRLRFGAALRGTTLILRYNEQPVSYTMVYRNNSMPISCHKRCAAPRSSCVTTSSR